MSAFATRPPSNTTGIVAFMHVVGASHDLYGLASYIHLADNQFICIRMLFNLVNLAYYDLRKIRVQFFILLPLFRIRTLHLAYS